MGKKIILDKGDLITFSTKEEYIVLDKIVLDSVRYICIASLDGISNFKICSYDHDRLNIVTDENLFHRWGMKLKNRLAI